MEWRYEVRMVIGSMNLESAQTVTTGRLRDLGEKGEVVQHSAGQCGLQSHEQQHRLTTGNGQRASVHLIINSRSSAKGRKDCA